MALPSESTVPVSTAVTSGQEQPNNHNDGSNLAQTSVKEQCSIASSITQPHLLLTQHQFAHYGSNSDCPSHPASQQPFSSSSSLARCIGSPLLKGGPLGSGSKITCVDENAKSESQSQSQSQSESESFPIKGSIVCGGGGDACVDPVQATPLPSVVPNASCTADTVAATANVVHPLPLQLGVAVAAGRRLLLTQSTVPPSLVWGTESSIVASGGQGHRQKGEGQEGEDIEGNGESGGAERGKVKDNAQQCEKQHQEGLTEVGDVSTVTAVNSAVSWQQPAEQLRDVGAGAAPMEGFTVSQLRDVGAGAAPMEGFTVSQL
jgi:hypothetical protein